LVAFFLLPFRLPFFFVAFFAVPFAAFFFLRTAIVIPPSAFGRHHSLHGEQLNMKRYKMFNSGKVY